MAHDQLRDSLRNKKFLVVGGAGFVGSNLVKEILQLEPKSIVIVDNLLSADPRNIPDDKNVHFLCGSIADDLVLANIKDQYDYIFQLATFHGNQNSIEKPEDDLKNNTLTSLKFFSHLRNFKNTQKVVYASAGCTVAEKTFEHAEATTENTPISPWLDSPYQISKIAGEFYGNYFFKNFKLPFVKARFQNVYGPGEILGAGIWRGTESSLWRNVIPSFIYKSLNHQALPVDNGGIATRDFIYVQDLVKGLLLCATNGKPGEVYNLASGVETTILDLANLINTVTKNDRPIDFKPARNWDHSGKRYGDPSFSKQNLGFEAKTSLRTGIELTVDWFKENINIIDRNIEKFKILGF